ncbi:MAG: hypothetical protein AAFY60_11825, partial [Myxococcota bacterium]
ISRKFPRNANAMARASEASGFGNPRRGRHGVQAQAAAALDEARNAVAALRGFPKPEASLARAIAFAFRGSEVAAWSK